MVWQCFKLYCYINHQNVITVICKHYCIVDHILCSLACMILYVNFIVISSPTPFVSFFPSPLSFSLSFLVWRSSCPVPDASRAGRGVLVRPLVRRPHPPGHGAAPGDSLDGAVGGAAGVPHGHLGAADPHLPPAEPRPHLAQGEYQAGINRLIVGSADLPHLEPWLISWPEFLSARHSGSCCCWPLGALSSSWCWSTWSCPPFCRPSDSSPTPCPCSLSASPI